MNDRIIQLISAAEQAIEEQRYDAAMELLAAAEQIEPNNKSIQMTKELVASLRVERPKRALLRKFFSTATSSRTHESAGRDQPAQLAGVQRRVRILTDSADYFFSRGAVDKAFELLMRAYLLDPLAPEVLACEKRILPAWQRLHGTTPDEVRNEWDRQADQLPKTRSFFLERIRSGKLFR
ncbi:MAG: hypothetical protein C4326_04915 [Ignavibacteria bacterium]